MEWKPINTAPKDGTPILGHANGVMTTVKWWNSFGCWELIECGTHANGGEWWPTDWMPLPEPPKG